MAYSLEGPVPGEGCREPEDPLSSRAASHRPQGPARRCEDQHRALSGDPETGLGRETPRPEAWLWGRKSPVGPAAAGARNPDRLPGLQTRLPGLSPSPWASEPAVPTPGCCRVGWTFCPRRAQPLRMSGCPSIPDGQAEVRLLSPSSDHRGRRPGTPRLAGPAAVPPLWWFWVLPPPATQLGPGRRRKGTLWAQEEAGQAPVSLCPGFCLQAGPMGGRWPERTGAWCPPFPTHLPTQGQERPEAKGCGRKQRPPEDGGPPVTSPGTLGRFKP